MNVGSLFSGIGGLDLGLERAGMTVQWQVERDPWCQRVLAKHWPDVPRHADVTALTGDELEPVDLICGGFPCQPVSVAGSQKGMQDARWLWPEFRRLVGALRPRYVFVENVTGLFTANGGHAFGEVIGELADLRYNCEWSVLSAADVGAPHLRKRVWLVAHADGTGLERRGLLSQRGGEWFTGSGGVDAFRKRDTSWRTEPDVGRVAHGVPRRVDRLRGLGNAVVPQCAEFIGRAILSHDAQFQ